jgi:hypothetical protein
MHLRASAEDNSITFLTIKKDAFDLSDLHSSFVSEKAFSELMASNSTKTAAMELRGLTTPAWFGKVLRMSVRSLREGLRMFFAMAEDNRPNFATTATKDLAAFTASRTKRLW